jgi:hypothetical protein
MSRPSQRFSLAKTVVCLQTGSSRRLFLPLRGSGKAAAPQDLEAEWDRSKRTYEKQSPPNGPALLLGKALGQQQTDTRTKRGSGASDEDEFRKGYSSFSHGSLLLKGAKAHAPQTSG